MRKLSAMQWAALRAVHNLERDHPRARDIARLTRQSADGAAYTLRSLVNRGLVEIGPAQSPGEGSGYQTTAAGLRELLAAYLAAKDAYETLVRQHADAEAAVPALRELRWKRDEAGYEVDALKGAAGFGRAGEPRCCQRYGRLHDPVFSRPGCPLSPGGGEPVALPGPADPGPAVVAPPRAEADTGAGVR